MTGFDHGLSKVGDAASQPEFEDHQSSLDDAKLVAEDAAYATDEWSEESVEAETSGTEDDLYEALYSDDGRLEHLPITNSTREALIERIMDEQAYKNKLSSSQPFNSKRKQEDDEDDEGQDRSDEREGPSKKKARSKESGMNIKFACPFRKHNPTKYDVVRHRLCALTPLETVARVKGHLYRKHLAPLHCGRCWQVFEDTNELTAHANRPRADICEATDGTAPEGVTTEQERKLRRKTRSYPNQSDESRWRDIYKVLFPGYPVPLPYFEAPREERAITPNSRSLDDYDNHMRERLPQLFRSRVEQHFNATVIQGFDFGNLLRECQEQVSRTFRETTIGHATNESTSPNANEARDQSPVIEGAASGSASSSNFVFEFLQPPPPQLDSQMLGSSLEANIRGAGPAPGANRSSDSGYSSGGPCNCIGLCTCQGTAVASDDPTNIENLSTSSLPQDSNIGTSSSTITKPPPETHPNHLDQDSRSREVLDPQQPTYYDQQTHNAYHIPENTGHPFNIDPTTLTSPFPDLDFWGSNGPPFHLDEFFDLGDFQREIGPENDFVSEFYFGDGPP
ncbi:uncharacterized protein PAC_08491 [Phialocephala subalpina]|uniref:C2H2-type domain-containing protein n=1 Tax=Phialocephala subalpina TaxID=576137 RepID=A0A1L7X0R7_9HELO|nr:uncharacterized protein PAC_08491 [Phialocephala subalpina]